MFSRIIVQTRTPLSTTTTVIEAMATHRAVSTVGPTTRPLEIILLVGTLQATTPSLTTTLATTAIDSDISKQPPCKRFRNKKIG